MMRHNLYAEPQRGGSFRIGIYKDFEGVDICHPADARMVAKALLEWANEFPQEEKEKDETEYI